MTDDIDFLNAHIERLLTTSFDSGLITGFVSGFVICAFVFYLFDFRKK